ncbi:MAG: BON domain-containing protein, partial [Chloroflexi bacterium]|nr:BON domain-containing protein [Chloroflexota bacterium]
MALELNIGAMVECRDGTCGRLSRLVVDPHTGRVTDIVVERGWLLPTDRVVPLEAIKEAEEKRVYLDLSKEDVEKMAEFHEREFQVPASNVPLDDQYPGDIKVVRQPIQGWLYPWPVMPMIAYHVHEGIPDERVPLRRGTPVHTWRGQVGKLDHVLVDRKTGRVTHLVVDRGFFAQSYLVPIEAVEEVGERRILLKLTEEELRRGPQYALRNREDVLDEIRATLRRAGISGEAVDITWQDGIITLTGTVPSVAIKRQVESLVRSVHGVIDVENRLVTAEGIRARVVAALAADARTDVALIDVTVESGVVTLTGRVDSQEIKEAAEEIAAAQEGVVEVVNDLGVEHDDWTEGLLGR